MADIVFYALFGVTVVSSFGVVVAKNPVGSLLFAVTTLGSLAGVFVLLEAHFLAAIQIIVYAGAIMVLFLFVIMLLNLGHDARTDLRMGVFSVLSFAVIGGIVGLLVRMFRGEDAAAVPLAGGQAIDLAIAEHGAVGAIAGPLYTTYVVPFEITGILLLVAIVGALVLAKRHA